MSTQNEDEMKARIAAVWRDYYKARDAAWLNYNDARDAARRDYGNAVDAEATRAFIEAVMEVMR